MSVNKINKKGRFGTIYARDFNECSKSIRRSVFKI